MVNVVRGDLPVSDVNVSLAKLKAELNITT